MPPSLLSSHADRHVVDISVTVCFLSTHADRHAVDILFTVCVSVYVSAGFLVTDISGVGWLGVER